MMNMLRKISCWFPQLCLFVSSRFHVNFQDVKMKSLKQVLLLGIYIHTHYISGWCFLNILGLCHKNHWSRLYDEWTILSGVKIMVVHLFAETKKPKSLRRTTTLWFSLVGNTCFCWKILTLHMRVSGSKWLNDSNRWIIWIGINSVFPFICDPPK